MNIRLITRMKENVTQQQWTFHNLRLAENKRHVWYEFRAKFELTCEQIPVIFNQIGWYKICIFKSIHLTYRLPTESVFYYAVYSFRNFFLASFPNASHVTEKTKRRVSLSTNITCCHDNRVAVVKSARSLCCGLSSNGWKCRLILAQIR